MAKRTASSELTRDNWDQDDEREDPGVFAVAGSDQIAQRKFRVAKRKHVVSDNVTKPAGVSVFGNFTGFGAKPSTTATAVLSSANASTTNKTTSFPAPKFGNIIFPALPPSSSDKNFLPTPVTTTTGIASHFKESTSSQPIQQLSQPAFNKVSNTSKNAVDSTKGGPSSSSKGADASATTNGGDSEFRQGVKSLNGCVIGWMVENFEENPYVNFAPVFDDYKKHFAELEHKHRPDTMSTVVEKEATNFAGKLPPPSSSSSQPPADRLNNGGGDRNNAINWNGSSTLSSFPVSPVVITTSLMTTSTPAAPKTTTTANSGGFSFGFQSESAVAPPPANVPKSFSSPSLTASAGKPFTFGTASTTAAANNKESPLSFGAAQAAKPTTFGAALGGSSTFSFGGFKPPEKPAGADEKDGDVVGGDDAEVYEPPKPERVEQVEDDAFYSVRCKLFYQKEGKFAEKGVGTLFLKPLDGGPKSQLLIRADTATGTVLLNVALVDSIPCTRNGKNNVTIACVPNPPLNPKSPSTEPAVMLIRVKTSEEADKLLEELNKAKSSA